MILNPPSLASFCYAFSSLFNYDMRIVAFKQKIKNDKKLD